MLYYWITADSAISDAPIPVDISAAFDMRNTTKEKAHLLPERIGLSLVDNAFTVFPDVYLNTVLFCSTEAKYVIDFHAPGMDYKQVVIINRKRKQHMLYYLPIVPEIDCLGPSSILTKDEAALKCVELLGNRLRDQSVFRIAGVRTPTYIMRQDLVEGLMTRGMLGFLAKRVAVV